MALTPKQKLFVDEYLIDLNATQDIGQAMQNRWDISYFRKLQFQTRLKQPWQSGPDGQASIRTGF